MGAIVGIIVIFIMVFGGFMLAGGKLGIIIKALPFELMMIGGSALGAFILSNDSHTIKATLKDFSRIFGRSKWHGHDYDDVLCLLYELIRLGQTKPLELEQHIEMPADSDLFRRYEKIKKDARAVDMICDTLRNNSLNFDDPNQVEDLLDKQLAADHEESLHSSHAPQSTADALPALGIVAAVLGIIKTMGSIDQPPTVLGGMIGGALVGTFLGVFMAYGFFGPFANKLKAVAHSDQIFYRIIRDVLIANLNRHPPNICVEVGRQNMPRSMRPNFNDLEARLRGLKA